LFVCHKPDEGDCTRLVLDPVVSTMRMTPKDWMWVAVGASVGWILVAYVFHLQSLMG